MSIYLLQQLLMETAERYPDKEAVTLADRSLTYGQLEKKSNQLARALVRLGIEKGDRVGLVFSKSIESIMAVFAILKAGATYVPIDPGMPRARAEFIISNSDIQVLLTSRDLGSKMLPHLCRNSNLKQVLMAGNVPLDLTPACSLLELIPWEEVFQAEREDYFAADMTDTYPAYILYTSGSTGVPKGVMISHLNSLTFVNMASRFFGVNDRDKFCSHAPLHFDLSVFDIFVAVRGGASVVLIPEMLSVFPVRMAEYIQDKKISVWNSVSSVLSLLAQRGKLGEHNLDSLRLIIFSGEILPVKYLRQLKANAPGALFYNLYGQTEANSSTFYQIKEIPRDDAWRIPIGKPFPNFGIFALNADGKPIDSPGEEGELFVEGSTVAMGYWRDPERTSASFVDLHLDPFTTKRVYRTGDLVRIDKDGNYVFVGRKDHLIKSRGYRIELPEIEIALNSHEGIKQGVVVAVPDDLIGNRIIAYVSMINGTRLTPKDISNHLSRIIPGYMIPGEFRFCETLPVTSTGKVDRTLLAAEAGTMRPPAPMAA